MTNWKQEKEKLMESMEWFKATPGEHKIKFLDDGTSLIGEFEGNPTEKIRFSILTQNKRFMWDITKGKTKNSLYGQLCLLGEKFGLISGQEITLLVKGEGKNKDYTIIEAVALQNTKVIKQ